MLVLSRKLGERIFIGDDIIVTVCEIGHHKVKIGVEAPNKSILRQEVRDRYTNEELAKGENNQCE